MMWHKNPITDIHERRWIVGQSATLVWWDFMSGTWRWTVMCSCGHAHASGHETSEERAKKRAEDGARLRGWT